MKPTLAERHDGSVIDTVIEFESRDGELMFALHYYAGGWLIAGWDWDKAEVHL